jgi:hypothetical protein
LRIPVRSARNGIANQIRIFGRLAARASTAASGEPAQEKKGTEA